MPSLGITREVHLAFGAIRSVHRCLLRNRGSPVKLSDYMSRIAIIIEKLEEREWTSEIELRYAISAARHGGSAKEKAVDSAQTYLVAEATVVTSYGSVGDLQTSPDGQ